jgi:hypothetical protein
MMIVDVSPHLAVADIDPITRQTSPVVLPRWPMYTYRWENV